MARVKLLQPEDLPDHPALVERIRSGRRGKVINVYKLLLHTPTVCMPQPTPALAERSARRVSIIPP